MSFTLRSGQTIGLVGQSGSGKSTIAKILTQLETPTSGEVRLDGEPIPRRGKGLRAYRQQLRMVFQDPFASLNPYHSIRYHLERPLRARRRRAQGPARGRGAPTARAACGSTPTAVIDRRPHELSGGQRQRVAIARALASRPKLLVADEPVSMLDVSIRLGVLNLLADLQREEGLGVLYITHDLATARHFSDEIMVLNQGRVVERGPADDVILRPQNPYTQELRAASPDPDSFFAHAAGILGGAAVSAVAPQLAGRPGDLDAIEVGTTATGAVEGPRAHPLALPRRPRAVLPVHAVGGDHDQLLPAAADEGRRGQRVPRPQPQRHARRRPRRCASLLGLDTDKSLWQQYIDYWGAAAARRPRHLAAARPAAGDRGGRPGSALDASAWSASRRSSRSRIGTIGGAIVGWRRGSRLDALIPITTFLSTIPYFWLGLIAIAVFSVDARVVPASARPTASGVAPEWSLEFIGEVIHHGTLPAVTIIIASLGGWMLGMRNMMLTVLDEDYITVAQAKGMPNSRVLWRYAARNAVLPQIQSFALSIGFIVGGTIVMEMVFSYPGVGKLLLDATNAKDYALMQGVFLVITLSVLVANILADIVYAFLDPRTRQTEA